MGDKDEQYIKAVGEALKPLMDELLPHMEEIAESLGSAEGTCYAINYVSNRFVTKLVLSPEGYGGFGFSLARLGKSPVSLGVREKAAWERIGGDEKSSAKRLREAVDGLNDMLDSISKITGKRIKARLPKGNGIEIAPGR